MDVAKKYSHAFEGETKMRVNSYPKSFTTGTTLFSPLPDENIIFYFAACNEEVFAPVPNSVSGPVVAFDPAAYPVSKFSLRLIKQPNSKICGSLVMSVRVKLYYSDGSLFKEYEPKNNIKVDQMKCLSFETVTTRIKKQPTGLNLNFSGIDLTFSDHSNKMMKGNLLVQFNLLFNDDNLKLVQLKNAANFSNNLESVYESNVFKDFVFNVGSKSFSVHKVILACHSPVFMKMLTQDFQESKTNSVTITDATPEIFEMFLKYLYSGKIEDKSWPSVKDLYCLAEKYDVGILKSDCTDVAFSLMSVDVICEILTLAYTSENSNLKSAASNFAAYHMKELLSRKDWNDLVRKHPLIGYEVAINFVPK